MTNKVIFLDRDGVINWDPIGDYIKKKEDFRFLPGVAGALKKLNENGYRIVVISNQAGVGDGVSSASVAVGLGRRRLVEGRPDDLVGREPQDRPGHDEGTEEQGDELGTRPGQIRGLHLLLVLVGHLHVDFGIFGHESDFRA